MLELEQSLGDDASLERVRAREWAVALRNGLKLGGSLLVTWSVALVVKLQVPRYLGPVNQGHFGFVENFAAMCFVVLGLGIDTHMMKEVSVRPKYASDILGGILVLRVLMSIVIFPAMALVLLLTGRSGEILATCLIFGAAYHVGILNATLGAVLQAHSHVGPSVFANIVTKIMWGAGLLFALHENAPLPMLAVPVLIGEALRTAIVMPAVRKLGVRFRIRVAAVRQAIVESVPYFVNGLALGILSSLVMSVLEFVRHDEREVGWFASVQNLGALCMLLSPLLFWVVMPLLARAHARSEEEGMEVLRRCLEGLVVAIAPITVLLSAGADFFIRIAFGEKYAPAATGLSILSLVFIMTYMNMTFANSLTILKKGWAVTAISIASIFVTAALMLVFVPLGRRLLPEGGECAGAATSVICSEACVLVAMITRYRRFPLDARNVHVFAKIAALAVLTLVLNHRLRFLGGVRLVFDGAFYLGLAFAIGVVRVRDIAHVIGLLRHREGEGAPSQTGQAEAGSGYA